MQCSTTHETDRLGRGTQFLYDADDRPVAEKWIPVGGGSPTNTITHTYDAAGRLTGIVDSNSQYAYAYDDADRLIAVDDAGTPGLPQVTLTYGYDDVGNRISLDDSLGGLTSYSYDVRDELTSITQSGSGVTAKRAHYEYDAAMRLTTLTRFSDLSGSTVVLKTRYSYDSADRLTTLSHQTSGGTVRVSYDYTLDAADRLTGESRVWGSGASSDTLTYGYTNDDQLMSVLHSNTSFADESFGYDANGNRNTSGYSTGTNNRLTSDGTYNYAYDDEGNTTSKTEIATGDQTLYSWDHRNRLTEVDHKVGATTTVLATFTYDALDRRIGEKAGVTTRWTLFDGNSPVLDFNGSGTQVARYLQSVDGVLARETSAGVAWYLPDRLGTVRDLADNSGAIIDHVDYTAFGGVIAESSPSNGDRLVGFARLERDTATGLNLAVYRAQDPNTGRWLSEDPIGFEGGDENLFRYVDNQPVDQPDPSGLQVLRRPFKPGDRPIRIGPPLISPPGTIPPVFPLHPSMPAPVSRFPGYTGPLRPGLSPIRLDDPEAWLPAMCNLLKNPHFLDASEELLKQGGTTAENAHETGMAIYYNPWTGEWFFLGIAGPPPGFNGFFPFGNPALSFPGGWTLIGLEHSHPFPPIGLELPGKQDIKSGQPSAPVPWYVVLLDPGGKSVVYGIVNGTLVTPNCGLIRPGGYDFNKTGGLILK